MQFCKFFVSLANSLYLKFLIYMEQVRTGVDLLDWSGSKDKFSCWLKTAIVCLIVRAEAQAFRTSTKSH